LYSDQPPATTYVANSNGHSKGVLLAGGGGGVFLQHSIPRFPAYPSDGYTYGSSQLKYGQHALCLTLTLSGLDAVAHALSFAYPGIYDSAGFDEPAFSQDSNLTRLVSGEHVHGAATLSDLPLTLRSGAAPPIRLYAKTASADADMVANILSPNLDVSLWSREGRRSRTSP
jgi:hypothetical protein